MGLQASVHAFVPSSPRNPFGGKRSDIGSSTYYARSCALIIETPWQRPRYSHISSALKDNVANQQSPGEHHELIEERNYVTAGTGKGALGITVMQVSGLGTCGIQPKRPSLAGVNREHELNSMMLKKANKASSLFQGFLS